METPPLSVVIPTHNGGENLRRTLQALVAQKPAELPFEVVLVDNNTADDSISRAEAIWPKESAHRPLRIFTETRPGAQYARWTGARAARAPVIVCCDDDNLLAPGFLQQARQSLEEDPARSLLGAFGVAELPQDFPVPVWFDAAKLYYAAGGVPDRTDDVEEIRAIATAGLVVRKEVFSTLERVGFDPLLGGRKGKSLVAGEDIEFCKAARLAGYRVFSDRRLVFGHLLPTRRLNLPYVRKLCLAMGTARAIHRVYDYIDQGDPRPPETLWRSEVNRSVRQALKALLRLATASRKSFPAESYVAVQYAWEMLYHRRRFVRNYQHVAALAQRMRETGAVSSVPEVPAG